jgi:glucoside 3-dehydrogenase (cytochrome c) hitch-hiker subunit
MSTRRDLLKAAAAATAAPLAAQHRHDAGGLLQVAVAYKPKVLTASEVAWFGKLCDAVIPRSDTPGASDAGVPLWIDRRLAGNAKLAAALREGRKLLDAAARKRFNAGFDALAPEQQTALLTPISADPSTSLGRFFKIVKDLTIDGYYSSKEGLVQELGYHGNTFLPEFKGCTHPEHQS